MKFLQDLPKATRALLIINVLMFLLSMLLPEMTQILALHFYESPLFMPHQLVTHFFMHGGIAHILFNMYALVLFGAVIEKQLGTKRFLLLYFFSAIGAFILHMAIVWYQLSDVPADVMELVQTQGAEAISQGKNFSDEMLAGINIKFNGAMVGASGAIMGLLLAFAILYPNAELMLFFIPYPIKAKYFMPIYMVAELFLGVRNFQWDNIAHFAHLGGALFGALLMFYWINTGVIKLRKRQG